MKPRSFRLRLALWSAFLTGIVLFCFAAVVDWKIRSDKILALDKEMRVYARREASHPSPPPDYWQHIEKVLSDLFSQGVPDAVILVVQSNDGEIYQSLHWPSVLNVNNLPWSTLASEPLPDRPPPFRGAPPPDDETRPFPPPFPPPFRHLPPPPVITTQLATPTGVWHLTLTNTRFVRMAIGVNLTVIDTEMAAMRKAFLLAVPLALLLIGIGAAILSGRALAPLRRLTMTMQQVTAKGLHQRIASGTEDTEFAELISVFNAMLERLERGFFQASRFSADAAHELKTPLAILQGQIEQTMAQVEPGSLVQIRLSSILDEIQRLSSISRKLLLLSLADAGRLRLHKVSFNLSQALEDLLEDVQMLAPELEVTNKITPNLLIEADEDLILQVLHNLISNAIKYNVPPSNSKGWIHISARSHHKRIEVAISNTAAQIAEVEQARIFERFYRVDPAHGRQIEGVGLGLSLSREIALAHEGELVLAKAIAGKVTFLLVF
jgi:signal transduction histidine kinase